MPHPKRPTDPNQRAKMIVDMATGAVPKDAPVKKNAAAVELGRAGGLKSAAARMEKLSAAERSAIAKKAAKARWEKD